jgi:hypothetical protein
MASRSVWVVLKVRLLAVEVEVEAVGGASVDVTKDVDVGKLVGAVSMVENEGNWRWVSPMVFMICADLVGRQSISSRVMGGKSRSRADSKEM